MFSFFNDATITTSGLLNHLSANSYIVKACSSTPILWATEEYVIRILRKSRGLALVFYNEIETNHI